jgi:hypothetical protein
MCTVFIDFKSAYNTVLREKLCEALENKNILTKNEVQFLRAFHRNYTSKCKIKPFISKMVITKDHPLALDFLTYILSLSQMNYKKD